MLIAQLVKESTCNAIDPGSIPGSGRSSGEGIGYSSILDGFPSGSDGKASVHDVGDLNSIPGSERSLEKEMVTHSSYSCLENPMDGGAW